jgi:uncharacterized protein (TIGR00255 family)
MSKSPLPPPVLEKNATASKLACKSMTGYAQARKEENGWALRISLRSVNHRFLDLHMRMPEGFEGFEPLLRQALREKLRRGHVDLTLHFDAAGPGAVQVNRTLAEAYWKAADELRQQFGSKVEPDPLSVLRLPGVIGAGTDVSGLDESSRDRLASCVKSCVEDVLEGLEEMRCAEGRHLDEEMRTRLGQISAKSLQVETLVQGSGPHYARKLEAHLRELLGDAAIDPARLAQEAALLVERGDIREELVRLRSHVAQFRKHLDSAGELGKKLDFLLQEMQREANTMLSKTPGVEAEGLAITELVLEIKGEIEKLREQVQNVE